ncbi:MAG TPA: hypothetical protein VK826_11375 [Bacteroidia bacterium]|nr:hypothetical protein [Bacteroidia bacterium]
MNHTFLFNEDDSYEAYDWNLGITCTGKFATETSQNKGLFRLSLVPDNICLDDCGCILLVIEKVEANRLVLIDSAYPQYNSTVKEPIRRIYKRIK